MKIKFTDKAIEEQSTYNLNQNPFYQKAVADEYSWCEQRYQRINYWVNKDVPTRNMLKALRMMPYTNTPQEWARLHVTEACMKIR